MTQPARHPTGVSTITTAEPPSPARRGRPVIVVLCGSTRDWDALTEANARETLDGKMVFAPGVNMKTRRQWSDPDEAARVKEMLDALHFAKIRAADEVLVVNVNVRLGSREGRAERSALAGLSSAAFACPHSSG